MSPTPGRNDAALTKLPASAPGVNALVAGAIVLGFLFKILLSLRFAPALANRCDFIRLSHVHPGSLVNCHRAYGMIVIF